MISFFIIFLTVSFISMNVKDMKGNVNLKLFQLKVVYFLSTNVLSLIFYDGNL